jgi:hypothetical protein
MNHEMINLLSGSMARARLHDPRVHRNVETASHALSQIRLSVFTALLALPVPRTSFLSEHLTGEGRVTQYWVDMSSWPQFGTITQIRMPTGGDTVMMSALTSRKFRLFSMGMRARFAPLSLAT